MTFIKELTNVHQFTEGMESLQTKTNGNSNFAMIYGEAGLGKTETIVWFSSKHNHPMLRAKRMWTARWMLEELCEALGIQPDRGIRNNFELIVRELRNQPRIIFIDELDHPASNKDLIETLRDITDTTGSKIVLVGMEEAKRKLSRHKAVYSRIHKFIEFKPLTLADTQKILETRLEVKVDEDATRAVRNHTEGNFRLLASLLDRLEQMSTLGQIDEVLDLGAVEMAIKMRGEK